jgi:hypothetical protein
MCVHVRDGGLALDKSLCPRTRTHAAPAFAKVYPPERKRRSATTGKLGVLGDLGGSMSLLLPLLLIQEALAVLEIALVSQSTP